MRSMAFYFTLSNASLWRSLSLKATHTFEFNTPGDPKSREGVFPILRQTAPYFGIKPQDIEEISNYIIGERLDPPLCCTDILRPYILPSLVCLFHLYFSQVEEGKGAISHDFWREIWREQSEANSAMMLEQEWRCQLEREWKHEWRLASRSSSSGKVSIEKLVHAFLTDATSVTPRLINSAYTELRRKLDLPEKSHGLSAHKPAAIESVIALSDRTANHALAKTLAHLWNIPTLVLEPSAENAEKMNQDVLLILSEVQMNQLKLLRLWGFSGAVLVIAADPFRTLRQRHRVLRFGQGSHKSFPAPWDLKALLQELLDLTPLAPENLDLLQREIKASSTMCQSHIDPCIKRLDAIERSNQINETDIEQLEITVGQIRADLLVACHASVTISLSSEEEQQLPIQDHFHAALENIRSNDMGRIGSGIKQFRQAASQLQHYVLEAW